MKKIQILFILLIAFGLPIFAQAPTKEVKEAKEVVEVKDTETDKRKISEIETNLKKQQQELEELKKIYGVKSADNKDSAKEGTEEAYVSPLKTKGLTPEYNRSMFLDPDNAKKFNKDQKPWLNDWVRVGANLRPRYEDRYNLGFDKQDKGYISRTIQTSQLFFIIDPSPYFSMKVNFQDARVWGGSTPASVGDNRAQTFAGAGNTITPGQGTTIPAQTTLREGWFMLKKLPLDAKLQVGRQILAYGDQRLLGGANWTPNGLSFDGARLMIDRDTYNLHFFANKVIGNQSGPNGVLSANAPILSSSIDPNTGKAIPLNAGLPNQYLVGTYDTLKIKNWFLVDAYSIGILTQRVPAYPAATLSNPTITIPATTDFDAYTNNWSRQRNNLWTSGFRLTNRTAGNNLAADSPWQGWDWTVEAAWQSGTTGARVNKNPTVNAALNGAIGQAYGTATPSYNLISQNQKYVGNFYVFQTGYTFFQKLRLGAQFLYASGDSNRTDGSSSTFQTLPGPRVGVIPYWNNVAGFSENIDTKNLISKTVNVSYKTDKFGTFYASYFTNDKAKTQDAWYAISGAANTGSTVEGAPGSTVRLAKSNRRIYSEFDLSWMYSMNEYLSLMIGGGILTAGDSVKNQKNAAYTLNMQTNTITTNNAIFLGQSGASSVAHMFFFQFMAAF
jgi:hypothetical protein